MVDHEGDHILKSLTNTLELALKYGDADDANIENYEKLAKCVCNAEWNLYIALDANKEASRENDVADFDRALEEHKNNLDREFKAKNSKRYLEFVKRARQLISKQNDANSQMSTSVVDADDDVAMTDAIVDIDPITKMPLENPVRNKKCGHIYGKQSIIESLQRSSRLRCPIIGCASKEFVKLADLTEDVEVVRQLEHQRRQMQMTQQ